MMCFKSTKLLLEDFQEYVFVDKIFEEYFSATGCCEVGLTDDWKNAESAAELSRVLRWIHLLTSWDIFNIPKSRYIEDIDVNT